MMHTTRIRRMGLAALAGALLLATGACNDTNNVTDSPDGGESLTASASNPSNGNGTMTATATLAQNNGGTGFDELNLSETVNGVGHEVTITWDTNTHAINSVSHSWFDGVATGGLAQCDPSTTACDSAKVAIDFSGQVVTLTSLALGDPFGGTKTSTLDGTVAW